MTARDGFDVVIIGAGITGTAAAYALSDDHEVLVIDKGLVGGDTTARASGFLSTPEAYPTIPSMGEHAMSFFRELDGTGIFSFTERQTIHVVSSQNESRARAYAEQEQGAGRPVFFYDQATVERKYPGEFDLGDAAGVLEFEESGWTDPFKYTNTLRDEAESNGTRFLTDTVVEDIVVDGDAVAGVRTEHGVHEASAVVCAAGWRTYDLLDGILEVPVKPARWEAVEVAPSHDLLADYPMGTDWEITGTYWRPTDANTLLVGGNPIPVSEKGERRSSVTDEFLGTIRDEVPELVNAVRDGTVLKDECCPTGAAATPDTMPIIDMPVDAPDGLVVATGFQRGGVLTSPCTATAVRSLLTGEASPFPMERFALDRFDSRSPDFELVPYIGRNVSD